MIFRRLFGSRDHGEQAPSEDVSGFDTVDEGDRLIVQQLRSIGADLSKPREVLHYLYLPTQEAADAARQEIEPRGYSVDVRPAAGPPGPNPFLCLATIEAVVSVESARASREAFTAIPPRKAASTTAGRLPARRDPSPLPAPLRRMSLRDGPQSQPGYRRIYHTDPAGRRHAVEVAGDGPAVVIIHELAGVSPMLLEFARRVRERGFATHLPVLIERRGGPARLLVAAIQVCVSAEFTKFARGKTSPIVGWLRSYGSAIHAETGSDIGVVGMCLTGGFALAMAVDPHVAASVMGHPTLPLGIGTARQRDLGLDPADLETLRSRSDLSVKGVRFSCDVVAPRKRFDRMKEEFGDRFDRTDVASGPGSPLGFSRWEHSVLNNQRIQPENPNRDAARAELDRVVDEVLDFLELRLRPSSRRVPA